MNDCRLDEPCMVSSNSIESVCYVKANCVMEHVQDGNHLNDEDHERKWIFLQIDSEPCSVKHIVSEALDI